MVVGLGNPGQMYSKTRHNVGFMVLDRVVEPGSWALQKTWKAICAQQEGVVYCKPQTFMNLSGLAVAAVAAFYKVPHQNVLVVLDDLSLELGRLRIRMKGSSGGHNGLDSILQRMGTPEVPRLRFGIGAAGSRDVSGFVLGAFSGAEQVELEIGLARAVEAVQTACAEGVQKAMNVFNGAFR